LTADTVFGCAPFTVRFTLTDTTGGATTLWDFGNGPAVVQPTETSHPYEIPGNYTVGVTVTWPNGCVTDTSYAQFVRVISVPIASASWTPYPPSINQPEVQFTDRSIPNVTSWFWDLGEIGTSTEQDPVFTFPDDVGGSYPLMLVVANELGCTDTLRTWVDVEDEFLVWVPNAFTPNDDAHNQVFFVSGNDISPDEYRLIIFDRWGHEVFNSTEISKAWDGTMGGNGGSVLPEGVYVWKLNIRSLSTRQKKIIMGHVTLLK
jgi:gliding motility-associated-like protein